MLCPYCLEALPSDGQCRACGGSLPTEGVSEPDSGSLWASLARLGALILPILSFLILIAGTVGNEKLFGLTVKWLKKVAESLFS